MPSSETRVLRADMLPQGDDEEETQAVLPAHLTLKPAGRKIVIVFAGNPRALEVELMDQIVIGRRAENATGPDIDTAPFGGFPGGVSRKHAVLRRIGSQLVIEDMGSSNGTYVEDRRMEPGEKIALISGQPLRFGRLHCWIYFDFESE